MRRQYVAPNYSADVDWSAPEQTAVIAEYRSIRRGARKTIRGGAVLYPTEDRDHGACAPGARGGEVVLGDSPYAETKEVLTGFFLHPRSRRPRRGVASRR